MCDFRIIKKIKLLDTDTILDITNTNIYNKDSNLVVGLYLIPATGSYHRYFDGTHWYDEAELWGDLAKYKFTVIESEDRLFLGNRILFDKIEISDY